MLLRGTVHQGRAVLQRVLAGRLVFNVLPGAQPVQFEAPAKVSPLFARVMAVPAPASAELAPRIKPGDRRGHEAGDAERTSLEVACGGHSLARASTPL